MGYTFAVECYLQGGRIYVYTGHSFWGAWRAYRKARKEGGKYFIIEWRPD
jgi:hypothetical protein